MVDDDDDQTRCSCRWPWRSVAPESGSFIRSRKRLALVLRIDISSERKVGGG